MRVREEQTPYTPRMTGVPYEKRIRQYLRKHLGEENDEAFLSGLLALYEAPFSDLQRRGSGGFSRHRRGSGQD